MECRSWGPDENTQQFWGMINGTLACLPITWLHVQMWQILACLRRTKDILRSALAAVSPPFLLWQPHPVVLDDQLQHIQSDSPLSLFPFITKI